MNDKDTGTIRGKLDTVLPALAYRTIHLIEKAVVSFGKNLVTWAFKAQGLSQFINKKSSSFHSFNKSGLGIAQSRSNKMPGSFRLES